MIITTLEYNGQYQRLQDLLDIQSTMIEIDDYEPLKDGVEILFTNGKHWQIPNVYPEGIKWMIASHCADHTVTLEIISEMPNRRDRDYMSQFMEFHLPEILDIGDEIDQCREHYKNQEGSPGYNEFLKLLFEEPTNAS